MEKSRYNSNHHSSNTMDNLNSSGLSSNHSQSPAKKKKKKSKNFSPNINDQTSSQLESQSSWNSNQSFQQNSYASFQDDDDEDNNDENQNMRITGDNKSTVSMGNQEEVQSPELDYTNNVPYGLDKLCDNFPYEDEDVYYIQVELLHIDILIDLAKACNFSIPKSKSLHQSRQRKEFILSYRHPDDHYGYKQLAFNFMLDYLGAHNPPDPTVYVEPVTELSSSINVNDILINKTVYSTEISSESIITQVSVNMDAPGYKEMLTKDINNGQNVNVATQNANSTISCLSLRLLIKGNHKLHEIHNSHGCNQILTMTYAQNKADGITIDSNIYDSDTVEAIINFLDLLYQYMEKERKQQVSLTDPTLCTQYQTTLMKVATILTMFRQHNSDLYSSSYQFQGLPASSTHRFDLTDMAMLHHGASTYFKFRFYLPEVNSASGKKFYTLISTNPQQLNSAYHTKPQVTEALGLGIICCNKSINGNLVGEMCFMSKDHHAEKLVQSMFMRLNDNIGSTIRSLPILCPTIQQKRLVTTNIAREATKLLMRTQSYSHLHISGFTSGILSNNQLVHQCLLSPGGIFSQLFIHQFHLIKRSDSEWGYETHTLDSGQYRTDTKSLVYKLRQVYSTCLPSRSLSVNLSNEKDKKEKITLVCTFLTEDQVNLLHNGGEVMAIRPIPYQHISQLSKLIEFHYQDKTLVPFLVLAVKLHSKVMLMNNTVVMKPEIALVLLAEKSENNSTISLLKSAFSLPKTCTQDSVQWFYNSFLLQIAHESRKFAFRGYPKQMQGSTTPKVCIGYSVHPDVNPEKMVAELQKDTHLGHSIRYAYKLPLTSDSMDIVIALSMDNINSSEIVKLISTTLNDLGWFDESETRLDLLTTYPGSNLPHDLVRYRQIQEIMHPTEITSSWTSNLRQQTKSSMSSNNSQRTSKTDRSTISNNSSSSSSAQRKSTIEDYYKPQQTVNPLPDTDVHQE